MVAIELGVSWNTAQTHLYKLMAEGSVKGRRIGRQNQWIISREERGSPILKAKRNYHGSQRSHQRRASSLGIHDPESQRL
jgi:predicted ArsR family transcriptional regulator